MKKVILLIGLIATVLMFNNVLALEEKMGLSLEWAFNTSAAFPDKTFGAGHQSGIAIADIDGDGTMEVLWGTRRGDSKRFWCLNGEDATLQWIFPPLGEDGLLGDPTTKVSLYDVNNDGVNELCFAGRGGRLWVIKPDGSILWTWDEPGGTLDPMHGGPNAADVDGDGFIEFFLNSNVGYIYRVNHLGQLVWTSAQAGAGNQGQCTLADIDQDGEIEVLFASQDFNLYCLNSLTGQEEWRFDTGSNQQTNQVYVADVNNDGEYEAVTWTDAPSSAVFIISFYGTELARWTHPREGVNIRLCNAMGDVDGDGVLDMAVMSGDAVFVISLGSAPATKWEANFSDWSATGRLPEGALADHWSSYQLIADIDADGAQEILWLAPYPIVTDGATGALEGYYVDEYIARNRRQENGGGWGDVDGDGVSEWVSELNGNSHEQTQIYCLTMGGAFPADAMWPEYYHSSLSTADQNAAAWLKLKASASNSLFFPMPEFVLPSLAGLLCIGLIRRK